jgi:serine/threonine protein kinase
MVIPDVFDTRILIGKEDWLSGDQYFPLAEIGRGGSGSRVFRVHDSAGKIWALKYLREINRETDPGRFARFMNEIRFAADYRHDNLLRIVDEGKVIGADGYDYPFYVMPLYADTLESRIKRGIPRGQVIRYFHQLLDAVEFIKECGFVHRDLKPENIFYEAENDRLVVADFGISDFSSDADYLAIITATNQRMGSMRYAGPEQIYGAGRPHPIFGGSGRIDEGADIWALGIMLNEMFTGVHPFSEDGHESMVSFFLHQKWIELDGAQSSSENIGDLLDELSILYNEREKKRGFYLDQWLLQIQRNYGYLDTLFRQMTHKKPRLRPGIEWIRLTLRERGRNLVGDE